MSELLSALATYWLPLAVLVALALPEAVAWGLNPHGAHERDRGRH